MVAQHDGRVLLVHDTWKGEWELPGGMIEDGEPPREAACRELREETGCEPGAEVSFVGVGTVQLGHERRIEYVAVYRTTLAEVPPFEVNDEVDGLAWWDPAQDDHPGLSPIDAHLARIAVGEA
jgi:8-oxo-dGTP pyrophosphatase MutT (NUDIX family)